MDQQSSKKENVTLAIGEGFQCSTHKGAQYISGWWILMPSPIENAKNTESLTIDHSGDLFSKVSGSLQVKDPLWI